MMLVREIFEAYDWADVIRILDDHYPPDDYLTSAANVKRLPTKGYSVEIIDEHPVAPAAHHDSDNGKERPMASQFPSKYIICRDKLPTQVTMTHGSLDAATAEAERLARKQNDRFMVFELIGVVGPTKAPLAWTWQREAPVAEHRYESDDARAAAEGGWVDDSDDLGDYWMGNIDPTDGEPFGAKG